MDESQHYSSSSSSQQQQHNRQSRMPDTPPHQNVRRFSHQPLQLSPSASSSQQFSYITTPTRSTVSPSSSGRQHSIASEFSGINLRDDSTNHSDKAPRPNLSLHPRGAMSLGSVPSSPTTLAIGYGSNQTGYAGGHPPLGSRTASDEQLRHYPGPGGPSNSRHSSPMLTASPSMSPYYSTTPHMLNSINEREQTTSWAASTNQAPPRQSPNRPPYTYPPPPPPPPLPHPGRDSVSPRSHQSQQSPSTQRHSLPHVPSYDPKLSSGQFSPRQSAHFPPATAPVAGSGVAPSRNISPTSFSPRHSMSFATMNREPGSMMSDIVYSNPHSHPPPAKFRIITSLSDLNPIVNSQPKFRRANPDGGFVSVCPPPLSKLFFLECVLTVSSRLLR